MRRFVTQWGGPGESEAYPKDHYFLQCFDSVGWVIWPAKTVPEMTYIVFSGTLNPTHWLTHAMNILLAVHMFSPDGMVFSASFAKRFWHLVM